MRESRDRRGVEKLGRALEQGNRRAIADLLGNILSETDQIEAKVRLPEDSKLAKHILAIANSGGGAVIIGLD
jgi:predicted HTH transcriptional regulator